MESHRKPYNKNQKFRGEEDYFKSSLNEQVDENHSSENYGVKQNEISHKPNHTQSDYSHNDQKKSYDKNHSKGKSNTSNTKNHTAQSSNYYSENNYYNYNYYPNQVSYGNNYYEYPNKFSTNKDYPNNSNNYINNTYTENQENYENNYYIKQEKSKSKKKAYIHNSKSETFHPSKINEGRNYSGKSTILQNMQKIQNHLHCLKVEIPEMTLNHITGLIEGSTDCMICGEDISAKIEIWQCNTCYTLLHNKCIYDWIFKLNSSKTGNKELFKWTCPHCNQNYQANSDKLPTYNCYCERFYTAQSSNHKEFDPELIPHGCGLKCNKEICVHVKCSLPCHPGPHLACNVVERKKCFCSRSEKDILCTNPNKKFSCNEKCNNFLKCNRHRCQVTCHEGECELFLKNKKCEECVEESKVKFLRFLKDLESRIGLECNFNIYSLADCLSEFIFNGTLPCGHHREEANTDNNLQFILKLIKISGNKLTDNIRKFVPICKMIVENSCDCKNKTTNVDCYKLNYPKDVLKFLGLSKEKEIENCTKACKTLKSCKIHRCTRVCCELANKVIKNYSAEDPLGYHLCMIPCEKVLACKKHKCENYCHKGPCRPCATMIREGSISCDCGKTKIQAPYQCGVIIECKFQCDKIRTCEHKCKLTCHSGECPPCDEITFKVCNCKKNVIQNLKCGNVNVPACVTPCQEMLPCGVHFCQIKCHDHSEDFDIKYFCAIPCGRDFNKCKHKCTKRCHGEDDCNEVGCESMIKSYCVCKVNSRNIKCGEFKKIIDKDPAYIIPCNEECKKKERLRKIEQAFDGLLKFSDENFKSMFKKSENPKEENEENKSSVKYSDIKFDNSVIEFVKTRIKTFMELEGLIDKAVINLEKKYEINNLDKKLYMFISELLKNFYNIKSQKNKNINDNLCSLVLTDCSEAFLPKYRLSLLSLLFKHRKFVDDPKISNPFEMSIFIQNYRYSVSIENIENHLLYLTKSISKNDFYVDEITKGKCYIHFFNLDLGQRIFNCLKNSPSQFQDCYEHVYEGGKETKYEDLYLYMKNTDYFNKLFYKDEDDKEDNNTDLKNANNPKSSDDEMDKDGFMKVGKNKKPK